MSRNILQTHKPYEENPINRTTGGKVILTSYKGRELALLLRNNRLLEVQPLDNTSKIGAIYIGKVKNIVKNLNACFVEIADGEVCFLPFQEAEQPFMLNRAFDGRILQGDELLVQVQRDALKTKQAAVTCKINLSEEYFVFVLGNSRVGISGKLSKEDKAAIGAALQSKDFIDEQGCLLQSPRLPAYGCVIRTEAGKLFAQDKEAFLEAFAARKTAFVQLLETAGHRTCFSCIQAPKKPYEAILTHFRTDEYEEVLTDLPEAYTSLQGHIKNVRLYDDGDFPLEKLYTLKTRLQEALARNVWLRSGANLVIEQTECLTTIDVNSGKMIRGTQKDQAVWKINEEAAREAALQIRLRNLSGIIIIDFINMKDKAAEDALIGLMKELTALDNIPTSVIDITPLGLMELTRKKVNPSLKEQLEQLF